MRISLMDRSLYFKGLLLLTRKDRLVGEREKAMMMRVGALFGFEKGFCMEVIDDVLTNRHVVDEPPLFEDTQIARCFVKDGLKMSNVDGEIHESELEWLAAVVARNHLNTVWYNGLLHDAGRQGGPDPVVTLEAERFVWA
ncbi:MAG: hypothetical protein HN712_07390 [Gemmatimonadetes bacterium]|jgi:hypothetical protein|nr:hypothetical protein [Gemmatimonadota bacterium]MBT7860119.1 hypothetical protein [Gemmatimonadota bacterium]